MKVIACYNIKGGVGKTSTAVNLAYIAARKGCKTLLWDMDLQGSATLLLNTEASKTKSIKPFSSPQKSLKPQIQRTAYKNLHLLPADFSLHKLDQKLGDLNKPVKAIKKHLASLSDKYAYVFIDCPAGYNAYTQALQQLADVFLIPVIPTPLTLSSYDLFKKQLKKEAKKNLIVFPFFSMIDRRKKLHREVAGLRKNGTTGFLHTQVPFSSKVELMAIERAPLLAYDTRSAAAKAYRSLWEEIITNLDMYARVEKIKMW
ncbi:MAG: ParA family protein [Bacteroidota bacterium]